MKKLKRNEWIFSFCDEAIDSYVYHIEQNVLGLEYHRLIRESYRKMMSDPDEYK